MYVLNKRKCSYSIFSTILDILYQGYNHLVVPLWLEISLFVCFLFGLCVILCFSAW